MNYQIPTEVLAVLEVQGNNMDFEKCRHKIKYVPIISVDKMGLEFVSSIRKECVKCGIYHRIDIDLQDKSQDNLAKLFDILRHIQKQEKTKSKFNFILM